MPITATKKVKTVKTTYSLTGEEVHRALIEYLGIPEDNVVVQFTIPGGGDWSYTSVDPKEFEEITVSHTETGED